MRFMKIILIFGPENNANEGLWSLELDGTLLNEFEAIFEAWQDAEEIYSFCSNNMDDIRKKFGYAISPEDAANEIMDEADVLFELLLKLGKKEIPETNLQQVFRPLNNQEKDLTVLQPSKGLIKNKIIRNPKLRIYAVRIAENTYVVTGGAIKLTDRMEERPHTKEQLVRLTKVKNWLRDEGILYPEDLNELS